MAKTAVAKAAVKAPSPAASRQKPSALIDTRVIYCGDNLEQLAKLPDACVDLIYIDPPFNSNRNYEVFWGETREKRAFEDRHESTRAYIDYMRPRCVQLARVLKKTGSFYYHCDWHASHYVKAMLDQIFGENNFQAEIIWKRTSAHSDSSTCGRAHDAIFLYTQSSDFTWNQQFQPYNQDYVESHYRRKDASGRLYRTDNLTAMGLSGGGYTYEWKGVTKLWRVPKEKMAELDKQGRIHYTRTGGAEYIRYLDEMPGMPLQDVWDEITDLVNDSLDKAEQVWEEVGNVVTAKAALANEALEAFSNRAAPVPTRIPGHEFIEDGKPLVDEFIAFVLDMRDSSKHLNMAIADTKASELKRVYYETAAVLPACSRIVKDNKGGVTEYLGDGLLAFFKIEKDERDEACYHAHDAAVDCIKAIKSIINPILNGRYFLPPIHIGVGMAYSKAILTLTGETDSDFLKPTAFGKCVFYATRLSKGTDEIWVDESLKLIWPKSEGGPLRFRLGQLKDTSGYLMYRAN